MKTLGLNQFYKSLASQKTRPENPKERVNLDFTELVYPQVYRVTASNSEQASVATQSLVYYLVKKNHKVLHVCLEKHSSEIALGYVAKFSEQSLRDLKNPNYAPKEFNLTENLEIMPLLDLESIYSKVEEIKKIIVENKIQVLVIDGFHDFYKKQPLSMIKNVYETLSSLADSEKILILTVEKDREDKSLKFEKIITLPVVNDELGILFVGKHWEMVESSQLLINFGNRNELFVGVDSETGLRDYADMTEDQNILMAGAMGTGKTVASAFTISTYLKNFSEDTTFFIVDLVKSAPEYNSLRDAKNVFFIESESALDKALDLLDIESKKRQDLLTQEKVENIFNYEKKTGQKLDRIIILLEEFHAIVPGIDFENKMNVEGSSAQKLRKLLRTGRSLGIWVIACTQRATKSDIPPEIVVNFTQKQIFKTSKAEASYLIHDLKPTELTSKNKGVCFSNKGRREYPQVSTKQLEALISQVKTYSGKNAVLSLEFIHKYLSSQSTKELYRLKEMKDLVSQIESLDTSLVLEVMYERLGAKIKESLDPKINDYGLSLIVELYQKDQEGLDTVGVAVVSQKDLTAKNIMQLKKGLMNNKCSRGTIYVLKNSSIPQSLYKFALDSQIEIVDHEDLLRKANQIDQKK